MSSKDKNKAETPDLAESAKSISTDASEDRRSAEQRYQSIIERLSEAALLLRSDGTILHANARFAQLANTPIDQLTGVSCYRFFSSEDQRLLESFLAVDCRTAVRKEFSLQPQGVGASACRGFVVSPE